MIPFIWGAWSNQVPRDREQDGVVSGWGNLWCLPGHVMGIGFQFCEAQTALDAGREGA